MSFEFIFVIFLILFSAFLSGQESAFLAFQDARIQTLIKLGDKRANTVKKLKGNIRKLLGTLNLAQIFCDVLSSALATHAVAKFGGIGIGLVTGMLTLVILIFGNLIPKSWAANQPDRWTLWAAAPLEAMMAILSPIVGLIDQVVRIFVKTDTVANYVGADEIRNMAAMGAQAGTVARGERELIERVFLFRDITAEDVMTPKESMVTLNGSKSIADVIPLINAVKFSRYPVYETQKDNIRGIVYIKDIYEKLTEYPEKPIAELKVSELMRPAIFIPETKRLDDLFREFQKHNMHLAVVVNEYGTATGIVSLEDLIEELVGEIADETDVDENVIKRVDKYTVVVHGDVEIQNVNRFFNTNIGVEGHMTISRLILEKIGSIPVEGQKIPLTDSITAVIEQADGRRIHKVRLFKNQEMAAKQP